MVGVGERGRSSGVIIALEQVAGIAGNTFRESVRQPVVLIILFIAVSMIAISPYTTYFTLLEGKQMIREMGLATMFLAGLLIAAFAASSVVSREIEDRTALSVLSKPVSRLQFILGKYLGVMGAVFLTCYVLTLVVVLTGSVGGFESDEWKTLQYPVAIAVVAGGIGALVTGGVLNFTRGTHFASTAVLLSAPIYTLIALAFGFVQYVVSPEAYEIKIDPSVISAAALVMIAVGVLAAVAVAASTRLQTVMTVVLCSLVFLLGLLSDYLFFKHTARHVAARVAYALIPNMQVLWMGDALARSRPVPVDYVVKAGIYAFCYIVAALFVAMLLFEDRQIS